MGKSTEEIKKMTKKETAKAPISPIWLGMRRARPFPSSPSHPSCRPSVSKLWLTGACVHRLNRPPRVRRLRRHNIRGHLAHLLRRPMIGRNDTTAPQTRSGKTSDDNLS